jgi:hypothetical protein
VSPFGWALIVALVVTVVVTAIDAEVGVYPALVLLLIALAGLSNGVSGEGSSQIHNAWSSVEAERKREALQSDRRRSPR